MSLGWRKGYCSLRSIVLSSVGSHLRHLVIPDKISCNLQTYLKENKRENTSVIVSSSWKNVYLSQLFSLFFFKGLELFLFCDHDGIWLPSKLLAGNLVFIRILDAFSNDNEKTCAFKVHLHEIADTVKSQWGLTNRGQVTALSSLKIELWLVMELGTRPNKVNSKYSSCLEFAFGIRYANIVKVCKYSKSVRWCFRFSMYSFLYSLNILYFWTK